MVLDAISNDFAPPDRELVSRTTTAQLVKDHGIEPDLSSSNSPLLCVAPNAESADAVVQPSRIRPPVVPLRGVVQHYAWGKPWDSSLVAAMAATQQVRSDRRAARAPPLDRGLRFAELWMGTHPNGHSSVRLPWADDDDMDEIFLKDLIDSDPEFWLGEGAEVEDDLPYLFKVLSVRQALSIQAHPNKKLAEELHCRLPAHYPDGNHKPEICIPLGHFEALAGFRPVQEIRDLVRNVEELQELCAPEPLEALESEGIRELYSRLMHAEAGDVREQTRFLATRLRDMEPSARTPEEELILRIVEDYPGDIGIFSVFFLNYVRITPDTEHCFIFCAPDEPHAYLLGECVECMALSDNVVRVGLTSKYKDVPTLLDMMTYRDDLLEELVRPAERLEPHLIRYNPPVDDFCVYEIDGPLPEGLLLPHAAITACIRGSMVLEFLPGDSREGVSRGHENASFGQTFFSRAGTRLVVHSAEDGARIFVATY